MAFAVERRSDKSISDAMRNVADTVVGLVHLRRIAMLQRTRGPMRPPIDADVAGSRVLQGKRVLRRTQRGGFYTPGIAAV